MILVYSVGILSVIQRCLLMDLGDSDNLFISGSL